MFCVSIDAGDYRNCSEAVSLYEFVELRLDNWSLSDTDLMDLFGKKAKILATCRSGYLSEEKREEILSKAINYGADYVDIELESSDLFKRNILSKAKKSHCKTIISYHNYSKTPTQLELTEIFHACKTFHTDVIKIVCFAHSMEDISRLQSLYQFKFPLISFAMGDLGKNSRFNSLKLGAPFTYVSMSNETKTAEGQIEISEMIEFLKSNAT